MVLPLRTIVFGHEYSRFERNLGVLFATGISVATFVAYALGLFEVTGGVVVLPQDATLVGFVAAVGLGSRRGGLCFAWLAHFGAYLGFRADWAFVGLSSHSLAGKVAFLLDPVGLLVHAVATLVIGTAGFGLGYGYRWTIERFK